ncbi:hypothetical protein ACWDUL_20325 [Nocardia niigatensis]
MAAAWVGLLEYRGVFGDLELRRPPRWLIGLHCDATDDTAR